MGDRVTWRLEILRGWGERLDPSWLPTDHTESWRRIFETEDLAARFCAAGGGGLGWGELARAVATLTEVLEQYRLQWRVAEQVATGCPVDAAGHVAAMAVPLGLRPPRLMQPRGRWRLCVATADGVACAGEFASMDAAEGAAVAARCGTTVTCWAEPLATRRERPTAGVEIWRPRVDIDLRLVGFAAEQSVADLLRAAATGHTGPDVVDIALVCRLGLAAHQFIKEYRTLFRAVWEHLEACPRATEHDAEATAALAADDDDDEPSDTAPWRHARLVGGKVTTVSSHDGLAAAAASVAAYRATDERRVRWAEPLVADPA